MKISKRESQRLEKRAQIVAIARRHFFEHGYDGTTMSAIAADIGGSKRTLWSYFNDKDELFTAVMAETAAGARAEIDMPSAQDGEPLDVLTRLCRSIIDRTLSPIVIAMFRLMGPVADRRPELSAAFLERGPRETQRVVGEYLRRNFADILWTEDFRSAGIDLVALTTAGMYFERLWGMSTPPTAKEKDAQARRGAFVFLRAFAKDPDAVAPIGELTLSGPAV